MDLNKLSLILQIFGMVCALLWISKSRTILQRYIAFLMYFSAARRLFLKKNHYTNIFFLTKRLCSVIYSYMVSSKTKRTISAWVEKAKVEQFQLMYPYMLSKFLVSAIDIALADRDFFYKVVFQNETLGNK